MSEAAQVQPQRRPTINDLRKRYDSLIAQCESALAVKDQAKFTTLRLDRRQAFDAWYAATIAEKHAQRDLLRPQNRQIVAK